MGTVYPALDLCFAVRHRAAVKRSKLIRRALLGALVLGAALVPIYPAPRLHSGVYVQRVTSQAAVLAKIDAAPRLLKAELRNAGAESWRPCATERSPRRRHALAVDGLHAGTRYEYRLLDGEVEVGRGSFRTAPTDLEAPLRFGVIGDSGGLPWWSNLQKSALGYAIQHFDLLPGARHPRAVGAALAAAEPDFWLHVGDVVYPRGEQRHYGPGFFLPFAEVLRRAPVYPVLGNHDQDATQGRPLLENFVLPTNDITGDERCFSFAFGSCRFIGLDLNHQPIGAEHPAVRFLARALADASEPWKFVYSHYPIYSASRHRDRSDLVAHVLPLLERYRVAIYFAGHDHNYQRFGKPGHGPVTVVTGGGGKSLYPLNPHPRIEASFGGYQLTMVDVRSSTAMTMRAVAVDGTVVDTVEFMR